MANPAPLRYATSVVFPVDFAIYQGFPLLGTSRAQIWSYSPRYHRPRHFHAEPELNLVVRGKAVFGIGERHVAVESGEFITFAPGQDHVLEYGSNNLELFAVGIKSDYFCEVLDKNRHDVVGIGPVRLARDSFRELVNSTSQCIAQEGLESQVGDVLLRFWHGQRFSNDGRTNAHVLTRRTLSVLLDSPSLGRNAIAEYARGNPTEISRHFHRDIGMTLVQYRARLRLLDVIRQVDCGVNNLTCAALTAGFGSYSQCHRQFLGQLGIPPQVFFRTDRRKLMEQAFAPAPKQPND